MSNDYKIYLDTQDKTRLEKIALEITKALIIKSGPKSSYDARTEIQTAIDIAKIFIEEMDKK